MMLSIRRYLMSVAALSIALLALSCTEPDKTPGSVRVAYSTKPGDELPFTWLFTIDGEHVRAIKSNLTGNTRIDSLAPGSHRLLVAGLPPACTTGSDIRTIDIPAGDTLNVSVAVTCTRTTGDLSVAISTTGSERDPDGYGVNLDGIPVAFLPPVSSPAINFPKLAPGNHLVTVTGVASNCTVVNGPTFPAVVTVDKLTALTITVSCVAVSGTLRVTTTTTGNTADLDQSGYRVTVGSGLPRIVAPNGLTTLSVIGGASTVTLSDVEPNCTAASTTANVTVPVGGSADVAFSVACGAYPATAAGATFTDPANDTLPNPGNGTTKSSDLIGLSTSYGPGFMTVTLKFSRPVGTDQLIGLVDFDTDENASTGIPPLLNSWGGSVSQGVEAQAFFQLSSNGTTATGEVETATTSGSIRVIVGGDSVRLIIPNERLLDDGSVTISAIIGPSDRPTDFMPNGTAPLVSRRPAGAVANAIPMQQTQPALTARRTLPTGDRAWKRPPDRE